MAIEATSTPTVAATTAEAADQSLARPDDAAAAHVDPLSLGRAGLAAAVMRGKIYLVGGFNGASPTRALEIYEPNIDIECPGEWAQVSPMLARRAYCAAVCVQDKVFVIGGSADGRVLNSMEVFHPKHHQWAYWYAMPPMQTKRSMCAAAVGGSDQTGQKLYVCGGFDGTRDLGTFESFDPQANSWKWQSPMELKRSYLALASTKASLYAIGGQDRAKHSAKPHAEVERFDLFSELWNPSPPLLTPRLGCTASVVKGEDGQELIFVCGGSDGSADVLHTVEVFDVNEGAWREGPPMKAARLGHSAAVLHNRLFVFGGFDGLEPLDSFEVFDTVEQCWSPLMKMGAVVTT